MRLSKKRHIELWNHVENEGFGYYMLHYGPDLDALAKLGFDKTEVTAAIKLFKEIELEINRAEEFIDEQD